MPPDPLHHLENIAKSMDQSMGRYGKSAFRKYPITFTLLTLFGVIAVSEGLKGILELIGFSGHPIYLLIAGLIILVFTGTLYRKLNK